MSHVPSRDPQLLVRVAGFGRGPVGQSLLELADKMAIARTR